MDLYFDNAASTIITKEVLDEMIKCQKDIFANPSSVHKFGRKAKTIIENCRSIISSKLKTSPGNIFFTSGGTEGDNMAIFSIARSEKIKNIITSRIEHPAVLQPIQYLMKNEKIISHFVDTDKNGNIDYQHLSILLSKFESNTLVSLMHANNEIGIINDIKKIGEICKKNNALFHSDAVQTVCHYEIDLSDIYINSITASAHKFHGPKGIGFIYLSDDTMIDPYIFGGGQERNMRAGTENISSILGMTKAFEIAYKNLEEESKYIYSLKEYMVEKLKNEFSGISFNGLSEFSDKSLNTVLSVNFPKSKSSEMLLFNLDIAGVMCSGGSACSSGTQIKSPVLSEINPEFDGKTVRFSFSKLNRIKEIDYTIAILKKLIL